jgi:hypothetical protein
VLGKGAECRVQKRVIVLDVPVAGKMANAAPARDLKQCLLKTWARHAAGDERSLLADADADVCAGAGLVLEREVEGCLWRLI